MSQQVVIRDSAMPDQATGARAHSLHEQVVGACTAVKQSWVLLAGRLHAFHAEKAWDVLGYDRFEDWLGTPEIGLSRSQAYQFIEAWQQLVIDRDVQPARLGEADVSKVAVVLPALKRGEVKTDEALADCESLSRSDLIDRYRGRLTDHIDPARERVTCPSCGSRVVPEALA